MAVLMRDSRIAVAPLENVSVAKGDAYRFGDDLTLRPMPSWVLQDGVLEDLGLTQRRAIENSDFALVAVYPTGLGELDDSAEDANPRPLENRANERIVFANLGLWLARRTPASFQRVLHAYESPHGGPPRVLLVIPFDPVVPIQGYDLHLPCQDLQAAAQFYTALSGVRRRSSLWTSIRYLWLALRSREGDVRYAQLWIAIEALFGPEDGREMTFRLSQRLAWFLSDSSIDRPALYKAAADAYACRSKIVHGRGPAGDDLYRLIDESEQMLRKSLRRILSDDQLIGFFGSRSREKYLNSLIGIQS